MNPAKLVATLMLISLTFGAGLEVNREHLFAALKNLGLLGRAFLANFIIVPVLGVLLAKLFRLPPLIATGFLLMAIAPGVPFILAQARKRGGSLGFAVELAVFLPLVSVVTVPLTADLVLPGVTAAELPLGQFVVTLLLFQVLPLFIGVAVSHRLPAVAPRLIRIAHIVFLISVVVVLVLLAPKLASSVGRVYGSNGLWAMLCLTVLSMVTGWLLGGPAAENRRVLGIGTTLRNIGLCLVLATSTFREPLVASSVLAYLLIQFIVVTLFGTYFTRRSRKEATA